MDRAVRGVHSASVCLRLSVLGGFRAERDGAPIPDAAWQRPTARTLVKLLAVQPGHRLHQEQILDLLWPDLNPASALGSLRKTTTLTRQALEPDLPPRAKSSFLHLINGVLSLDPGTVRIDADAFETRAHAALNSDQEDLYREALAAYPDQLLPEDRYEDWVTERREALTELHLKLLLGLAGLLEQRGASAEAIENLEQVLAHDPLREEVHRRLMRRQVASGNRHQALRQYQRCRQILQSELGVEPEPETTALYEEIAAGKLSGLPAATLPISTFEKVLLLPRAMPRLPDTPLMGRERPLSLIESELALAEHVSEQDARERRGVILIGGEAGIGKTRLVAEAVRWARARGTVVLWGGNYQQEGTAPYAPFIEALEEFLNQQSVDQRVALAVSYPELASLLPGLTAAVPASEPLRSALEGKGSHMQLFTAMVRFLVEVTDGTPLLLVLDDLQAADEASFQLLHHLARVVPDHPWLIVGTYREEDVRLGGAFEQFHASLTRAALCRNIDLLRLSRSHCDALAASLLPGATASDDLLDRIYSLSLGNPLFTRELVLSMRDDILLHEGAWMVPTGDTPVPPHVRELILERVMRLTHSTRQVLSLVAAAGMETTYTVLRLASSLEETVLLDALDEALDVQVLEERDSGFAFYHPLLRETLYERLSRARRSHLHVLLGQAIEEHAPDDVDILAYHFARGGDDEKTILYLEKAGDRAAGVYAADAAIAYYHDARSRLNQGSGRVEARTSAVLARLDEKLGETLHNAGRYDEAIPVLERAEETYREIRDLEGAGRAAAWLGRVHNGRGTAQAGLIHVEPMVELLAWSGPSPALASLYRALAVTLQILGRHEEMLEAAERLAEIAGAIGDECLLASALERRGTALIFLGRTDEAMPVLEKAVSLLERVGDLDSLWSALGNMGEVYRLNGKFEDARQYTERGLEVAKRAGNPALASSCLMGVGDILLSLGRWREAREYLEQAEEVLATLPSATFTAPYIPAILSGVLLAMGDWDGAETALQRALGMAESAGDRQALEVIHLTFAELEVLRGEPDCAVTRLEPLAGQVGGSQVMIESTLAWALLEGGDVTRARELATGAVERARTQGEILALVDALRVQGMVLRKGGHEEAEKILEEGLTLAQSLPYPYAAARILVELGRLEESLAIFQRLGAIKDVERTERAVTQPIS